MDSDINGGRYAQHITARNGLGDLAWSVNPWYNEKMENYPTWVYGDPDLTDYPGYATDSDAIEAYGHFTQLVCVEYTHIGCTRTARNSLPDSNGALVLMGTVDYVACNPYPTGMCKFRVTSKRSRRGACAALGNGLLRTDPSDFSKNVMEVSETDLSEGDLPSSRQRNFRMQSYTDRHTTMER